MSLEGVLFNGCVLMVTFLLVWWVMQPAFTLSSSCSVFVLVWGYYNLSVPLDLIFGLPLEHNSYLPDLSSPENITQIRYVFLHAVVMFAAFVLAYFFTPAAKGEHQGKVPSGRSFRLPPAIILIAIVAFAGFSYANTLSILDVSDRGAIDEMARSDITLKLNGILVYGAMALCFIYIIKSNNNKQVMTALACSIIIAVVTGSRHDIVFPLLVYMLRSKIRMSAVSKWVLFFVMLAIMLYWKKIYSEIFLYVLTGKLDMDLLEIPTSGLAMLESLDSYAFFVYFLLQGQSPLLLGQTYTIKTLDIALPRFLREGVTSQTLAEQYAYIFKPNFDLRPGGMGFSALAEAWLNFGDFGPLLLGIAWGVLSKRFDTGKRDIPFYIFCILTFRLFRCDFASLIKTSVVIFSGILFVIYMLICLTNKIFPSRQEADVVT